MKVVHSWRILTATCLLLISLAFRDVSSIWKMCKWTIHVCAW